jgi:hypothetical protein
VELGVLIASQVFCYVDLLRQYDDDVSVLKVDMIRNEMASVKESYRLLIENFSHSSTGVILPQQELEPGTNLVQFCVLVESFR